MKIIADFIVKENRRVHNQYSLIVLSPVNGTLPSISPGQFVQVDADTSKNTFLRRPISINYVDIDKNELWLLVRRAGEGTAAIMEKRPGEILNLVLPLGNTFTVPQPGSRCLLAGGGVGVAPMLYWGKYLKSQGFEPHFLLGARSAADLLELEYFQKIGEVHISTDDGSCGEHGLVTENSILNQPWDYIYCCGPSPMMKGIARVAAQNGVECEVSLENMMACGLGACLCCVEKTVRGNVCVCTEGPIFNIKELTWLD